MTSATRSIPKHRSVGDPRSAEIDARPEPLPAVPAEHLQPGWLRAHFCAPPDWAPELIDDRMRLSSAEPRAAAVLVALITRKEGPMLLLTQRTAHLSSHAGQIAFPGGRTEPTDASPAATALREAQEEVGLDPACVEVLGCLPEYRTGTGFIVTPVVGLVDPSHTLRIDPNEVDHAFEVPLAFLMDPANHQRRIYRWEDAERSFFAMPWRDGATRVTGVSPGPDHEYFIWGATAAMLRNLYRFLSA